MKEDHRTYIDETFAAAKRKPEKLQAGTGFLFSITAMIFFQIFLHPAVLMYDFHKFITSVPEVFAKVYSVQFPSRVFSLYGLFSQSRSCDNTLENCFFQI